MEIDKLIELMVMMQIISRLGGSSGGGVGPVQAECDVNAECDVRVVCDRFDCVRVVNRVIHVADCGLRLDVVALDSTVAGYVDVGVVTLDGVVAGYVDVSVEAINASVAGTISGVIQETV